MRKTLLVIMGALILMMIFSACKKAKNTNPQKTVSTKNIQKQKPDLGFTRVYPDPVIENLTLPGTVTKYGADNTTAKIIRTLRFKNITSAVEEKYDLPNGLILAMIMEESTGVDLMPNGRDDGGFGLVHMQPQLAVQFSLKTYAGCKELKCFKHGRELRGILAEHNYDRKTVLKYDDRFHPILNVDAAGRMLKYYWDQKPIKGYNRLESAICRYAGRYNFKQYWRDVQQNMKLLKSKSEVKKAEKLFNKLNPNLRINGEKADFKAYIFISQQQAWNYDLQKYASL